MYDFSLFKQKLDKILSHVKDELNALRTGKASPGMLDTVKVEAYGSMMAINELANISTPDSNMIVVDPWDKNLLDSIEKGIRKAGINLNPVVDKEIIRIVVPSLTEETRRDMVKQLNQKIESAKVMMRAARTETKKNIEDQEGESGVSEDDIHRDLEDMDKMMDEYEHKLEEIQNQKEGDLLKI